MKSHNLIIGILLVIIVGMFYITIQVTTTKNNVKEIRRQQKIETGELYDSLVKI